MNCRALQLAASKWVLGAVGAESLPESATAALVAGCDSPSLRRLAGLSGQADIETTRLFETTLSELGLTVPIAREAVMMLSHELANMIVTGAIAPYEGAKQIWELTLRVPQERISQLDSFVYAASEWAERPAHRNVLAEGIVAAAQDLVAMSPD